MNYYNEFDPTAAAWLRELISENLIPQGHVDTRSITEVSPSDLCGFTQCHFFAGIGGWALALRLAGWPDDQPVWTGSCPCQPFSVAGKQKGTDDERHLWPEFRRLISQCNPHTVFGEQVASAAGLGWLAQVRFDLETIRYWGRYHESLYEVRKAAEKGRLPEILGEIIGRVEADLSGVPTTIREKVAEGARGAAKEGAGKAEGQRIRLPPRIRPDTSRGEAGERSSPALQAQGSAVRSTGSSSGTGGEGTSRAVRNEWTSVRLPREGNGMEQPVVAPGETASGVHNRKHQGDLFRSERRLGELGGVGAQECCEVLVGEELINDERRIAEVFERGVADSLERLRLSGIRADLEGAGYACGAADLCAAGVGAPHIRQRLYWVADSASNGRKGLQRRAAPQVPQDGPPKTLGAWNCPGDPFSKWKILLAGACVRRLDVGVSSGLVVRPALRCYGNAIVPQLAATFIRAFLT